MNELESLSLRVLEREAVIEALRRTNSQRNRAARLLGISDRTLRDKIKQYSRDGYIQIEGDEKWLATRAS